MYVGTDADKRTRRFGSCPSRNYSLVWEICAHPQGCLQNKAEALSARKGRGLVSRMPVRIAWGWKRSFQL